jgi:hypothetical protein
VLSAHVPGEGVAAVEIAVPARGVRLQLGGTGGIEGRVRGLASGSFTFTVEHCLAGGAGGEWPVVGMRTAAASSQLVHVDGGSFLIDDLPACTLQAVVRTANREQHVSVQVRADREASLELDLSEPVVTTVHGTVYDAEGHPAPHTDVRRAVDATAGSRFPLPAFAETDADGRFEIDVHAGDTLVFFGPRGQATLMVGTAAGARRQRVDVSLTPLPPVHPRADYEGLLDDPHSIIDW